MDRRFLLKYKQRRAEKKHMQMSWTKNNNKVGNFRENKIGNSSHTGETAGFRNLSHIICDINDIVMNAFNNKKKPQMTFLYRGNEP